MRKVPALIATAGLVLATLTACSPGSAAADCTAPVRAGDASDLVSVTGDLGSAPTVDFPTPLKTDTTQRSEIIAGDGPGLVQGQMVQVDVQGRLTFDDMKSVVDAAARGAGIAFVYEDFARHEIAAGSLLRILEEYSATDDAFHIYYPHRSHMPGKLRAFVDFMRDANRRVTG